MREISLNGDRTADPEHNKPGRDLAYMRYDKMARRRAATPNISNSPGYPPRLTSFCLACAVAQPRDHCCGSYSEATFQASALVCVGTGAEENGGMNCATTEWI